MARWLVRVLVRVLNVNEFQIAATEPVVLSFSLPAEADFSFLAEEEPDAARAEAAALVQGLAWLPVAVEEERAYFEGVALGAARAVRAVDAGAAALGAVAVVELAADALAAELVVDAGALVADAVVAPAGGALAAELVADVVAAGFALACSAAEALAADEPAAELVVGAQAVDCDSAEYSVARHWAACWAVAMC